MASEAQKKLDKAVKGSKSLADKLRARRMAIEDGHPRGSEEAKKAYETGVYNK